MFCRQIDSRGQVSVASGKEAILASVEAPVGYIDPCGDNGGLTWQGGTVFVPGVDSELVFIGWRGIKEADASTEAEVTESGLMMVSAAFGNVWDD